MTVSVRLFAAFREAAGTGELGLELPDGSTVLQAWQVLSARYPGLAGAPPSGAINARLVDARTVLTAGDQLAFLPPVSGG